MLIHITHLIIINYIYDKTIQITNWKILEDVTQSVMKILRIEGRDYQHICSYILKNEIIIL